MSESGPILPTCALQQVGSYRRYWRRAGRTAATAVFAESARGISPRAAHRSRREPLDSSGSCHRAKAAAFHRLSGSSRCRLTRSHGDDLPPSLHRHYRLHHYYEAVRPSPAHRYFRPRGWSHLFLFPWHRRPGSHVPYQSQIELRAAYMPDAAWAVSGIPQTHPGRRVNPRF